METAVLPNKVAPKKPKIKLDFKDSKYATGRRKKSIAKIWVKKGTGKFYVNGRTMDEYSLVVVIKCKLQDPSKS